MKFLMLLMGVAMAEAVQPAGGSEEVERALQRFVDDYRQDQQIQDITFGVEVAGESWTVTARRPQANQPASASLTPGVPQVPTFVWAMDRPTFDAIAGGRMSAMTAMASARSSDPRPLEVRMINGFNGDNAFGQNVFRPLAFHFWTIGRPEIVRFGFDRSRLVHGGRAIPGMYAPGIRTSWYGLLPGDHINEDPRSQLDPWTSLFFIIRGGSARARIGDTEIALEDNSMIQVPPQTRHEFWNPGTVPAEMIMVTFGQNS